MKMEPRNLSAFLPLVFAKLSLFHNPQNLPCPPRFLLSFYLFSFWPLPFVSMCHSSEAFSSHSRLLIFQFSGYHNSLLCLEQIIPTTITCSFLPLFWAQRLPAWKAPFFWCSWEVAATMGGVGHEAHIRMQTQHQKTRRGDFTVNYSDIYTLYFVNPKSQAMSWYHCCLSWTLPILPLCSLLNP